MIPFGELAGIVRPLPKGHDLLVFKEHVLAIAHEPNAIRLELNTTWKARRCRKSDVQFHVHGNVAVSQANGVGLRPPGIGSLDGWGKHLTSRRQANPYGSGQVGSRLPQILVTAVWGIDLLEYGIDALLCTAALERTGIVAALEWAGTGWAGRYWPALACIAHPIIMAASITYFIVVASDCRERSSSSSDCGPQCPGNAVGKEGGELSQIVALGHHSPVRTLPPRRGSCRSS